jgi:hypothetical protein
MSFIDGFFDNVPLNVNHINLEEQEMDVNLQKKQKRQKLWAKPTPETAPTESNTVLKILLGKKKDTEGNIS